MQFGADFVQIRVVGEQRACALDGDAQFRCVVVEMGQPCGVDRHRNLLAEQGGREGVQQAAGGGEIVAQHGRTQRCGGDGGDEVAVVVRMSAFERGVDFAVIRQPCGGAAAAGRVRRRVSSECFAEQRMHAVVRRWRCAADQPARCGGVGQPPLAYIDREVEDRGAQFGGKHREFADGAEKSRGLRGKCAQYLGFDIAIEPIPVRFCRSGMHQKLQAGEPAVGAAFELLQRVCVAVGVAADGADAGGEFIVVELDRFGRKHQAAALQQRARAIEVQGRSGEQRQVQSRQFRVEQALDDGAIRLGHVVGVVDDQQDRAFAARQALVQLVQTLLWGKRARVQLVQQFRRVRPGPGERAQQQREHPVVNAVVVASVVHGQPCAVDACIGQPSQPGPGEGGFAESGRRDDLDESQALPVRRLSEQPRAIDDVGPYAGNLVPHAVAGECSWFLKWGSEKYLRKHLTEQLIRVVHQR